MPRPAFGSGDSMSIISEKGVGMAIKDVLPVCAASAGSHRKI